MDNDELRHLLEMHTSYVERIRILDERRAAFGTLSTAETVELAKAKREKAKVAAQLQVVSEVTPEARAALGEEAPYIILELQHKQLNDKFDDNQLLVMKQITQLARLFSALRRQQKKQAERIDDLFAHLNRLDGTINDLRMLIIKSFGAVALVVIIGMGLMILAERWR